MKNYKLNLASDTQGTKGGTLATIKKLFGLMATERKVILLASIAIIVNSGLTLIAPIIIGHGIDNYIVTKQFHGVLVYSGILLVMYFGVLVSQYIQTKMMGGVGQRVLFTLRNSVFQKLQELPVAFFNQNKAGDLISRINNDSDKLNQFFSQSFVQFLGGFVIMIGAGIFILGINPRLGLVALLPAAALLVFTQLISPWIKRKNAINLQAVGGMSAEIQESLNNFKVVIAFNRRDYFRQKFNEANIKNYNSAVTAGLANNIFTPIYGFSSNLAQLLVLAYGIYLISTGLFTVGLLISFLAYIINFYTPLRQIASLWSSLQIALAGWDRIAAILSLDTDLLTVEATVTHDPKYIIEFSDVGFIYPEGVEVLKHASIALERGKKYALVGPTGGGKTTTASLMARLFDPTSGQVLLGGVDIRSYSTAERAQKIGFILQEPFLFNGTLRENIAYGNQNLINFNTVEMFDFLKVRGLDGLMQRFEAGLDSQITASGDAISLGQKQLIAFMRAVLRDPELLILDEATANIDTITEQLLEEILKKLPTSTTQVIIAHRLNTIENADQIFFINSGQIIQAGSLDNAVDLLLHGKRES